MHSVIIEAIPRCLRRLGLHVIQIVLPTRSLTVIENNLFVCQHAKQANKRYKVVVPRMAGIAIKRFQNS